MAAAEPVVTMFSPPFSPRIFYNPVRQFPEPKNREPFVAVPYHKHAVVDESLPADQRTGYAADVCLHEHGVKADGERAAADQMSGDLILVDGNGGEIGDLNCDFVGLEVALAAAAGVRV